MKVKKMLKIGAHKPSAAIDGVAKKGKTKGKDIVMRSKGGKC